MSRVAVVAVVGFVWLAVIVPAHGARSESSPKQQMSVYLAAMRPHAKRDVQLHTRAVTIVSVSVDNGFPAYLSPEVTGGFRTLAAAMAKVRAPVDLRSQHAGYVRSARIARTMYAGIEKNVAADDIDGVEAWLSTSGATLSELRRHWRTEVTAKLRRLGMSVPLWVKKVGA